MVIEPTGHRLYTRISEAIIFANGPNKSPRGGLYISLKVRTLGVHTLMGTYYPARTLIGTICKHLAIPVHSQSPISPKNVGFSEISYSTKRFGCGVLLHATSNKKPLLPQVRFTYIRFLKLS